MSKDQAFPLVNSFQILLQRKVLELSLSPMNQPFLPFTMKDEEMCIWMIIKRSKGNHNETFYSLFQYTVILSPITSVRATVDVLFVPSDQH